MLRVDFVSQLIHSVLVRDVTNHQSSPPVMLDELRLHHEWHSHRVDILLIIGLAPNCYSMVMRKIVSAGETLLIGVFESTPNSWIFEIFCFLQVFVLLVGLVPSASDSFLLNFRQHSVWTFSNNIGGRCFSSCLILLLTVGRFLLY